MTKSDSAPVREPGEDPVESPFPPHPRVHPGGGTGTRVWLVRHAEVHADWKGKAYGDIDVPLSEEGEERTRELGRDFGRLPLDAVACSPLSRAAILGRAIATAAGLEALPDDGLREIQRGSWQGLLVEELHARFPEQIDAFYADPWSWAGHGGESDEAIAARAWPAVERTMARATGGTVLLACHYNVIRVLAASALAIPPVRSFAFRIDTGRGTLLIDGPEGWELVHSNVHAPPRDGGGGPE